MNHFLLFPDYRLISNYTPLSQDLDGLIEHYTHTGYPISLNSTHNGKEWIFIGTHLDGVKLQLETIISQHHLVDHRDNILFILLYTYQLIDDADEYLHFNLHRKSQTKQLAKLLLALKVTPEHQLVSLNLKTVHESGTTKITDQELIKWIYKGIQQQLASGSLHPGFMTPFDMALNSEEDLKTHAEQVIPRPTRAPIADYFMPLHKYLINETDFKPEGNAKLSDDMARFYFELLTILEVIKPDDITSEPKDYIHACFTNHARRVID